MRVREIALRVLRMPLVEPFETSMERTTERLILLVEAAPHEAVHGVIDIRAICGVHLADQLVISTGRA